MRILAKLFLVALALHCFGGANAASTANAARLVAVAGLEAEIDRAVTLLIEQVRSQMTEAAVPAQQVDRFISALDAELRAGAPQLVSDMTQAYAAKFTDAEIEDLIAFYESPTGQKLVEVQSELAMEQVRAIEGWLVAAVERAQTRYQKDGTLPSV